MENLNFENRRAQYWGDGDGNRAIDATLIKRRKNNKRGNIPHIAWFIAVYQQMTCYGHGYGAGA